MKSPKNREIRVKLSTESHKIIKQKATSNFMTMASYLRFVGLNSNIKVASVE